MGICSLFGSWLEHLGLWQRHHTVADIFPITVWGWGQGHAKHFLGLPGSYVCVRGNTGWNHSSWPDTIVTICMSYFTTGDPVKEHGTNKTPPTGRIWERSKGDPSPYVLPTSQKPSLLESVLAECCVCHQEGRWIECQRQPGNKSYHHKTQDWEPCGKAVPLGSLTLLVHLGAPSQCSLLLYHHTCCLGQFISVC